uniref:Uncharacterized protein n=1 Tax=Seriola lalandi dorsalis TaxID=1841481 RepID=A0A3B4Y552_SERLL
MKQILPPNGGCTGAAPQRRGIKYYICQDSILEPLCFPEQPADGCSVPSLQHPSAEPLVCLFCSESVPLLQKDVLLKHLLLEHKMVIADVKLIADLPKYEPCSRSAAVLLFTAHTCVFSTSCNCFHRLSESKRFISSLCPSPC